MFHQSKKRLPFEIFEPAKDVIERNHKELVDSLHDIAERRKRDDKCEIIGFQTKDMKNHDLGVDEHEVFSTLEVMDNLSDEVNSDVCLNGDQIYRLLFNSYMGGVLEGKGCTDTFFRMHLATWLNSIRNECFNCLNDECIQRDPSFPHEEALKRKRELEEKND